MGADAYALPVEIWMAIVRYAVAGDWPSHKFFPPGDDFSRVRNLGDAAPFFRDIIKALPREWHMVVDGTFDLSDVERAQTKHLNLVTLITNHNKNSLARNLHKFTQLRSLAVYNDANYLATSLFRVLPFLQTLERLDYMGITGIPWRFLDLDLPNLTELRIGAQPFSPRPASFLTEHNFVIPHVFDNEMDFAECIAKQLKRLKRLRFLSLHIALDNFEIFSSFTNAHMQDFWHLQPSEGYMQHYSDCQLCRKEYNLAEIVKREDAASKILAKHVSSLEEIKWLDAWKHNWTDDVGQRLTKITREKDDITLERENSRPVFTGTVSYS